MSTERDKVTVPGLAEMKLNAEPIVMVTAYDFPSAEIAEQAGVDLVLVGDTAAMTMLGHSSTTPVSLDEMLVLARAVRRGLRTPLLVGDLPFGTYERSNEQAVETATRYVKEAGCDVVKLERGGVSVERAKAIIDAGVPVMGHVGLTPQTATALGGFRAQEGRPTRPRRSPRRLTRSRPPAASRSSSRRSRRRSPSSWCAPCGCR